MNIFSEYRHYLLEKTPASKQSQYIWLAASIGIIVFVVLQFPTESVARSLLLLVIGLSLAVEAITNLAFFKNKSLFEKLVNVKIALNVISLGYIVVFLVLTMKNKL